MLTILSTVDNFMMHPRKSMASQLFPFQALYTVVYSQLDNYDFSTQIYLVVRSAGRHLCEGVLPWR